MTNIMSRLGGVAMQVDKPGRMIVRRLDGKPLREADGSLTWFDIYSIDSEVARKHERTIADERLAQRGRGSVTAADIDSEATEYLVAITAGWGVRKFKGEDERAFEDIPAEDYTPAAARKLYADPQFADIRRQVDEYARAKVNFAKASPKG